MVNQGVDGYSVLKRQTIGKYFEERKKTIPY